MASHFDFQALNCLVVEYPFQTVWHSSLLSCPGTHTHTRPSVCLSYHYQGSVMLRAPSFQLELLHAALGNRCCAPVGLLECLFPALYPREQDGLILEGQGSCPDRRVWWYWGEPSNRSSLGFEERDRWLMKETEINRVRFGVT